MPRYLEEVYHWAYLEPRNVSLLDREFVVRWILWQQHKRLQEAALSEIAPGVRVLQPACVYGDFTPNLAHHIGAQGHLEVIDVAPIQVANCERKLRPFPHATVRRGDAMELEGESYDAICCYFLLHELPGVYKRRVVDALLGALAPGGKLVFVDYHKPHWAHPLRPVTSVVFGVLEPFAKELWQTEIAAFASRRASYDWRKETCFGGLFQKVVCTAPT